MNGGGGRTPQCVEGDRWEYTPETCLNILNCIALMHLADEITENKINTPAFIVFQIKL